MNKKQALALLARPRGRGRPSKAMSKKLAMARKIAGQKESRPVKLKQKMGKTELRNLVKAIVGSEHRTISGFHRIYHKGQDKFEGVIMKTRDGSVTYCGHSHPSALEATKCADKMLKRAPIRRNPRSCEICNDPICTACGRHPFPGFAMNGNYCEHCWAHKNDPNAERCLNCNGVSLPLKKNGKLIEYVCACNGEDVGCP